MVRTLDPNHTHTHTHRHLLLSGWKRCWQDARVMKMTNKTFETSNHHRLLDTTGDRWHLEEAETSASFVCSCMQRWGGWGCIGRCIFEQMVRCKKLDWWFKAACGWLDSSLTSCTNVHSQWETSVLDAKMLMLLLLLLLFFAVASLPVYLKIQVTGTGTANCRGQATVADWRQLSAKVASKPAATSGPPFFSPPNPKLVLLLQLLLQTSGLLLSVPSLSPLYKPESGPVYRYLSLC